MVACPECEGTRLKKLARWFRLADKDITQLSQMSISDLHAHMVAMPEKPGREAGHDRPRCGEGGNGPQRVPLGCGPGIPDPGPQCAHLSGGEAQRIRLATQIGSQLTGVLYILDEPSIGLHMRDDQRLIGSLRQLRDGGNTVLVVEHDKEMMMSADHIIDIGPGAGVHGGHIVAQGTAQELMESDSITAKYLRGESRIAALRTAQGQRPSLGAEGRQRQQPEEGGRGLPAGHLHLRDRCERQRQEHLDRRYAVPHPEQDLLPQRRATASLTRASTD
ncbi:MAG: hypothetical protein IPN38_06010 [Flavobacteriales bacterium]|nr:hypothetical protein [Flavobacteriales bacterium]